MFVFYKDQSYAELFLTVFGILTNVIVILFIVGVFKTKPEFILAFNFVLKVLISIWLIYRFNIWNKDNMNFTNLDRKMVVSVSIYSLLISFMDVLILHVNKVRGFFSNNFTDKLEDINYHA